jgi:hypothetical protein
MAAAPTLQLVCEKKISDLLPADSQRQRWEASGLLVKDDHYFVVFDDHAQVARLSNDLQPANGNGLFGLSKAKWGFEGISYNEAKQRFYLLVEARRHKSGNYQAIVVEYNYDFKHVKQRCVDFTFKSDNKGFEAIAYVNRGGVDYLLALCEGNNCQCGRKGRTPGRGRVQLFAKKRERWKHAETISLPPSLPFVDYSGMSVDHGRVAVVSQENSMLWVGRFNEADWSWRDEGRLYEFPRFADGSIQYGNIEGVGWITPSRVVAVSDRRKKKDQPDKRLAAKDQSIHVFDIPS